MNTGMGMKDIGGRGNDFSGCLFPCAVLMTTIEENSMLACLKETEQSERDLCKGPT